SREDASAARNGRTSVRHDQGPDGSNPLPDEDAKAGQHRDGAARARLQPHARDEYHRHWAAPRGHQSIAPTPKSVDLRPLFRSPPQARRPGIIRRSKSAKIGDTRPASADIPSPSRFCESVFTRPRPEADMLTFPA